MTFDVEISVYFLNKTKTEQTKENHNFHLNSIIEFPGKTCKMGEVVIKYGEFKIVGKKVCTCVGDWYPRAFCNQKIAIDVMKQLMNRMCVADARNYKAWEKIEELYKKPQLTPPPLL